MPQVRDIAYISGPVVKWARDRAGLSQGELAVLNNVDETQVYAWERGDSFPTFSQAEKLADKLRLPFAILFLDKPPEIELPIPDLRTVAQATKRKPSLEFFDVVSDALIRQRWYREYQQSCLHEHSVFFRASCRLHLSGSSHSGGPPFAPGAVDRR